MITTLGGGVGAAKFLKGLSRIPEGELFTTIVNTGDDIAISGLRISPDIDTIIYRLSGLVDKEKGWGIREDTFHGLEALGRVGVGTWIVTDEGEMHIQEYLVKRGMKPKVKGISIKGIENARPAPGVLQAIEEASGIIVCPSNPIISIGPMLQVRGVREALKRTRAKVIAISPLVGGAPLKGPADKLMRGLGL